MYIHVHVPRYITLEILYCLSIYIYVHIRLETHDTKYKYMYILSIEIRDRNIPILLLANKMDIRGSLTAIQVNDMYMYMYTCIALA